MILAAIACLLVLLLMGEVLRQVAAACGGLILIGVLVAAYGWPLILVVILALAWMHRPTSA